MRSEARRGAMRLERRAPRERGSPVAPAKRDARNPPPAQEIRTAFRGASRDARNPPPAWEIRTSFCGGRSRDARPPRRRKKLARHFVRVHEMRETRREREKFGARRASRGVAR